MKTYNATQLSNSSYANKRAQETLRLAKKVCQEVSRLDESPSDKNKDLHKIKFREDGFTFSGQGQELKETSYQESIPGFLSTNFERATSNGHCVALIEDDTSVGAVKVVGADADLEAGESRAVAYNLFSEGGLMGPVNYSSKETKNGTLYTMEFGGFQQRTLTDADGRLVEYSEGSPSFWSELRDKIGM